MTPTQQRDRVAKLARTDTRAALEHAKSVSDPWFRAQAFSWVARFTDGDPEPIAAQAAKAAAACDDDYQRSSVRAWEIAALAERGRHKGARHALRAAVATARTAQPAASRSEALMLLFQAALAIDRDAAKSVSAALEQTCPIDDHWRCKRAAKDASEMLDGKFEPRKFFW